MRIEILPQAKEDLLFAYRFYQDRSPGLGTYFIDSVFSDIGSLVHSAGIHRVVYGSHRCLAKRFPFSIHYKIDGETVRVIAVLDCRRDPTWIRRRLRGS